MAVTALECPNCGASIQQNSTACTYCGTNLHVAAAPSGAAPAGSTTGEFVSIRLLPQGAFDVRALINAIGPVTDMPAPLLQNRLQSGQLYLPRVAQAAVEALRGRLAGIGVGIQVETAGPGRPAGPPGGPRGGPRGPGGFGRGGPGRPGGFGGPGGRR